MEKFKEIRNACASELVLAMRTNVAAFDYLVQRDTLLDVADLLGCVELQENKCEGRSFTRFWGLREHGTVMCRTNDFGEWEHLIVARFRIDWNCFQGFTLTFLAA